MKGNATTSDKVPQFSALTTQKPLLLVKALFDFSATYRHTNQMVTNSKEAIVLAIYMYKKRNSGLRRKKIAKGLDLELPIAGLMRSLPEKKTYGISVVLNKLSQL